MALKGAIMQYKYLVVSKGKIAKLYDQNKYLAVNECMLMPTSKEFEVFLKQKFGFRIVYKECVENIHVLTVLSDKEDWSIKWIKLETYLKVLDDESDLKKALIQKVPKNHDLLFGIRGGNLVRAVDLGSDDRGAKCNCLCPSCGANLVAKLGSGKENGRIKHFAHEKGQGVECDINRAHQTALHILAKDIIERRGTVMLPPVEIALSATKVYSQLSCEQQEQYGYRLQNDKELIYEARRVSFDCVKLEDHVEGFVPDIVVSKNGQECYIEIAVTHFVDDDKEKKIRKHGVSLVEIDLSCFADEEIDEELLTKMIEDEISNKKWIYNAKWENPSDAIEEKAKDKCKQYEIEYLDFERTRIEHEEKRKRAEEKENRREERRKQASILLAKAFEPKNYRQLLQTTRNDERFFTIYKELKMYKECPQAPFYVDIPISGEFIFDCDRRIWQSMLFDKFVFNRNTSDLSYKSIEKWVIEYQNAFGIRWEYNFKCEIDGVERHLLHDMISGYFSYLHSLGFVLYRWGYNHGGGRVLASQTTIPPDQEYASILQSVIDKIDTYAPNVDDLIYELIYSEKKG